MKALILSLWITVPAFAQTIYTVSMPTEIYRITGIEAVVAKHPYHYKLQGLGGKTHAINCLNKNSAGFILQTTTGSKTVLMEQAQCTFAAGQLALATNESPIDVEIGSNSIIAIKHINP